MAVQAQSSNFKNVMLTMVVFVYILCYGYAATSLSALLGTITKEMGWTVLERSGIISALPLGTVIFTFVAGVLLDKFSTRIMMFCTIVLCGVAIFLRGNATGYSTFLFSMFLLGVAQAIVFPGAVKTITTYFTRDELFKANGIVISGAPIGMILGFFTAIPISGLIGWQNLYRGLGIICVIFSVIWLVVAKDIKASDVALNQQLKVDTHKDSLWDNLKAVLGQKQTWLLVFAEVFYQSMIQIIIAFGASVIVTFPGVTPQIAAMVSSLSNLGSLFGYYVLPRISDKFGLRKPFIWPSMLLNTVFILIAYTAGNIVVTGICLFVGFFWNGWSLTGPRSMLQESPGIAGMRAGTAIGLMTTMSRLGQVVYPFIFAGLLGVFSPGIAISIMGCSAIISTILILLTKETGIGREAAKKLDEEKKAAKFV